MTEWLANRGVRGASKLARMALVHRQGPDDRVAGHGDGRRACCAHGRRDARPRRAPGHRDQGARELFFLASPGGGSSLACRAWVRAWVPSSSRRSATSDASPAPTGSPPTPGSRPSRATRARRRAARRSRGPATIALSGSSSKPRSPACTTEKPAPTTTGRRSEGKRHSQAVLALARRRLNVLWSMLHHHTLYDPHLNAA